MEDSKLEELAVSLTKAREQRGSRGGLGRSKESNRSASRNGFCSFKQRDDSLPDTELYTRFVRGQTIGSTDIKENKRKSETDEPSSTKKRKVDIIKINNCQQKSFFNWVKSEYPEIDNKSKTISIIGGSGFVKSVEVAHLDSQTIAKVKRIRISNLSGRFNKDGWLLAEIDGNSENFVVRVSSIRLLPEENHFTLDILSRDR